MVAEGSPRFSLTGWPSNMPSQKFAFFSAMLGFLIINAMLPTTAIGTTIVLSIIWAGAGFRYAVYGVSIWAALNIPSLVSQTNIQEGLLLAVYDYGQNLLTTTAQSIGTPQAQHALSYASQQLTDATQLLMWWPFEFALLSGLVLALFLSVAWAIKPKWSRRLEKINAKVKPY